MKILKNNVLFLKKLLTKQKNRVILIEHSRNAVAFSLVGVDDVEGPPVPIPNTVVKLNSAENTWLEAAREDRSTPTLFISPNSSVGRARGC